MLKQLFEEYRLNLNHFFDEIDIEKAEEIFHLFLNCKGTLIFSGVGKSGIIAEKLAMTMISTGTKALYLPPMNALHGDIGVLSDKDILVCISKSGETQELLSLLPVVKSRGAKTVSWVCNPHSRLYQGCDVSIELPFKKELCPFDLAPTTSTAIQLIFGDALSVALMKAKKFSLDAYALNHPAGHIGKKVTMQVQDVMLRGKQLPTCRADQKLRDVMVELSSKRCGCLLIVDEKEKLEGVFTDGDLRRALQKDPEKVLEKKIGEIMTNQFTSINPEARALEALHIMEKNPNQRFMMLPVLDKQRLIGLIHLHDIISST